MKKNSKISIIIAVYNTEQYLKQCLDSIINQTFKDFEIIIVNDCSTDDSFQIIKNYQTKDDRIVLVNLSEHVGIADIRNEGLKHSCGKYIVFIDSDDWVSKDYIEFLYNNIEKEQTDMFSTSFYFYNDKTDEYKEYKIPQFYCSNDFSTVKQKQKLLSIPSDEFMLGNKIYNRSFLMKNNLKFNMYNREDVLFNYEVFLLANKLKFINNPLYFYRKNRESSLTSSKYMLRVTIELLEKIIKMIVEKKIYVLYGSSYIKFSFLYVASEIANSPLYNKKIENLLQNFRRNLKEQHKYFSSKFLFYCLLFFLNHSLLYIFCSKFMRLVYRTIIK